MKRSLLTLVVALFLLYVKAQDAVVESSGNTFVPAVITVAPGTTVNFNLGSTHNAVEVSEETWNNNDTLSNGGFRVPFDGGEVTFSSIGTYYYVCQPHVALGMKGIVHVQVPNAVSTTEPEKGRFFVYPNPVTHSLNISFHTYEAGNIVFEFFDHSGRLVLQNEEFFIPGSHSIRLNTETLEPAGYILRVHTSSETKYFSVLKL